MPINPYTLLAQQKRANHPREEKPRIAPALPRLPFVPFPTDVLPLPVATFIRESAACIGCDESFIALPLLAGLGAAIGTTRRLILNPTWREFPTLWTSVIADSGEKKSPALRQALGIIERMQRDKYTSWREAMDDYEVAEREYRQKSRKAGGDAPPPRRPVLSHLMTQDTTVEAIAKILEDTPRGTLMARGELSGWFYGFNQYKGGSGGDVAHWVQMFDGDALKVDRKGADTIYIPQAAVPITGMIQPETLRRCLKSEYFDVGLAARFIWAWPPIQQSRWTTRTISEATVDELETIVRQLYTLDFQPGEDHVPVDIHLTPAAEKVAEVFVNLQGEDRLAIEDSRLRAAHAKMNGMAARLALIVHFCKWAADPLGGQCDAVDEPSFSAGVVLANWFYREAERVYSLLGEDETQRHYRELAEFIRARGGCITPRELQQARRACRDNVAMATQQLNALVDAGVGRWEYPAPQGGRPSKVFVLDDDSEDEGADGVNVYESGDNDPASAAFVDVDNVDRGSGAGAAGEQGGVR